MTKNIIHLNNVSTVKDLFLKHGGEKRWRVQSFICMELTITEFIINGLIVNGTIDEFN
jgi:hypothetical protein